MPLPGIADGASFYSTRGTGKGSFISFTDAEMSGSYNGRPDVARMTHAEWLEFIRRVPPPALPTHPAHPMQQTPPSLEAPAKDAYVIPEQTENVLEEEVCSIGKTFFVEVRIGKKRCSALLDTGSEVTLIPKRMTDTSQLQRSRRKLRAANGTEINLLGEWHTEIKMGTLSLPVTFLVSDQINEVLIGIDWMRTHKCLLSFDDLTLSLSGRRFPLIQKATVNACHRIVLDSDVEVPAKSEMMVSGRVVYANLRNKTANTWVAESKDCAPGVKSARCVVEIGSGGVVPVRVLNINSSPTQLREGTEVGLLQEAEAVSGFLEALPVESARKSVGDMSSLIQKMVSGVHPDVSDDDKIRLEALLTQFSDVLSKDEYDMGLTDQVEHEIDTGQERPVRQQLRKTPMAYHQVVDAHIQMMIKQGLIEPSKGEWASNIVLVLKKDKTFRFCIDYRKLNASTRKDVFPLPRIDASLDALGGASWFSTLDFRSGYFQVPLSPKDAHKTAFISRSGSYQWKVLPMGLCNSAFTFQRLMNMVLAGLTYTSCLVYLDDIIVMSNTLDEHLNRLNEVFLRIRAAKLKLRPDKCKLLQREVTFLGHVVSANGIAMDANKLAVMRDWPTPQCLREVRAFVGLCAYYRRYVKDFSVLARPLHLLTHHGVRFVWTPECQEAFDTLKEKLTSAPIIALPREEGEFRLDTDASNWAIGAVLSQVQDGEERVIAYGSRMLSSTEARYCTTRRELLAVVYFAKYYRQYLLGRRFLVRTDHAALQWLQRTPDPIGQQACWLEQLASFDFFIVHRPGVKHGNADGLSRNPCRQCGWSDENCEIADVAPIATEDGFDWSSDAWRTYQAKDTEISEFVDLFKQFPDRKPTWAELEGYSEFTKIMWTMWSEFVIRSDVLYRVTTDWSPQTTLECLVVPYAIRREFIRAVHEGMTGGHGGISRTRDQVRRRGYWPGWTKTVELFVKACPQCARYHRGKAPKQGPLKPMIASYPFETISVDVTGPHPRSSNGYVYILTIVDHFSKFAFAHPMRNQEVSTVAKILLDHVICLVGAPARILTDQGSNFESQLFRELCQAMGIAKVRTSPYKASTNGCVERFHLTLNAMLAKCVKENQRDWDAHLQPVMAAYRASRHASNSMTPNCVIFGRENVMPADLIMCDVHALPAHLNSASDFVSDNQDRFRAAYQMVRDQLKVVASKRKSYYDMTVRARLLQEGDLVWYFYPRQYVNRSRKWGFSYVGPYRITKKLSDSTYVIKKVPNGREFVTHIDKLKKCKDPSVMLQPRSHCSHITCEYRNTPHLEVTMRKSKKVPTCKKCASVFTRRADLKRHDESIHQMVRWECPECQVLIASRANLKRHIHRRHKSAGSKKWRKVYVEREESATVRSITAEPRRQRPLAGVEQDRNDGTPEANVRASERQALPTNRDSDRPPRQSTSLRQIVAVWADQIAASEEPLDVESLLEAFRVAHPEAGEAGACAVEAMHRVHSSLVAKLIKARAGARMSRFLRAQAQQRRFHCTDNLPARVKSRAGGKSSQSMSESDTTSPTTEAVTLPASSPVYLAKEPSGAEGEDRMWSNPPEGSCEEELEATIASLSKGMTLSVGLMASAIEADDFGFLADELPFPELD